MDRILSKAEVAEYLKVSPRSVDAWVRLGTIPFSRVGKRAVRFRESAIDRWLAERECEAVTYGRRSK